MPSYHERQPTTQQISWFLDLERNNQLNLNPPYQRKSLWSPKDRRFFLDTIFRNYPTPPIFIHRTIDDNGFATYHVVDGKQCLETVLGFAKNKIAIDSSYGDINYNGKKFNDLTPYQKRKFWDYNLVVDFIEAVDGANIDQVFDRVNRNSINLQPQELRHARFNGWFINEAEDQEDDFWWTIKVRGKECKNNPTVRSSLNYYNLHVFRCISQILLLTNYPSSFACIFDQKVPFFVFAIIWKT